jgi:hypothetical protein
MVPVTGVSVMGYGRRAMWGVSSLVGTGIGADLVLVIVSVSVRGRGEGRRRGGFAGIGAVSMAITVSLTGMSSGLVVVVAVGGVESGHYDCLVANSEGS